MKLQNPLFCFNSKIENQDLITYFCFSFNLRKPDFDRLILKIEEAENKIFPPYYLGIENIVRDYEKNSYTSFVMPKGNITHYQFRAEFIRDISFVMTSGVFLENLNEYTEYRLREFLTQEYFPQMFGIKLSNADLNSKDMNLIIN